MFTIISHQNMKTQNIKKTRLEKENIRLLLVKSVLKGKMKVKDASLMFDVNYYTACGRCRIAKTQWIKALKSKKNKWWRPVKKSNNLTLKEEHIITQILEWEPRECKELHIDFWLWTIKLIQDLIDKIIGKQLKHRKVREFLIKIGYTNQKPIYKAYQQNPEQVTQRIQEHLPLILSEAELEWREVFYWDESWFKSTDHRWKTWAKKWHTPVVHSTWARFSVNAISIISSKWQMRFMVYEGWFTSQTLITFLQRLVRWNTIKYTLILDWHPTHKSKRLKQYLESIDDQVKIYCLPWYSPELNPDELLWHCVKVDLKWTLYRSKQELCDKVLKSLHSHQKQKSKIKSFFLK